MQTTEIAWTDTTWNPVRGCTRVSAGCQHCYAERQASRFSGEGMPYEGLAAGGRWTGKVELIESKLADPLRWRKPRRVFVNSMSDIFHEALPDEAIAAVFGVMSAAPQHSFQVLTKRPERMRQWFEWAASATPSRAGATMPQERINDATHAVLRGRSPGMSAMLKAPWPLPNVWLGVSVEDQATADARIPLLLDTPAAVRFLSVEPLLEPVDLTRLDILRAIRERSGRRRNHLLDPECHLNALTGHVAGPDDILPTTLNWVIVGGESGPGARPCDVTWIRSAVEQCKATGVACFVKQLGASPYDSATAIDADECVDSMTARCRDTVRHPKGGDPSEWPEDLRVQEFPSQQP